ncbi:MAG: tRNA (N(6)-L-threonylcarbamoyladenosine(37)-C(2))-methylthiotransferase MtaB [Erysipelotrichaceae bacterium]
MKFAICNLGCKVNNYEANWYRQQLAEKYQEVDFKQFSDIYIINSCTVTNMAGAKTRQMIHKARKQNPDSCIAVVGCYVQMESDDAELFRDCDILIGSKDKTKLPDLIEQFFIDGKRVSLVENIDKYDFEEMFINDFNQIRAYLKIQDGCNQFCSYCVIPYARGRERCLPLELVLSQARALIKSGHSELVLTGIHTGRWHDRNYSFSDLVEKLVSEVEGLKRLRISSIEVTEIDDKLIDLMANNEIIAHHLHIPLQSGSDFLLRDNNRPYTTQYYLDKVNDLRNKVKDISISSDVIVGLPNETEELFQQTIDFIEKAQLSFLHVFPYARKKHTVDYDKKNQVDAASKKDRVGRLTNLSMRLYNNYASSFIGQNVDVLFEKYEKGINKGHCSQYLNVELASELDLTNQFVKARVISVNGSTLIVSLK